MTTKTLGPVGQLLADRTNWERDRDCSTELNRITNPTYPNCVRWSLRAATELKYPNSWREEMVKFMKIANTHYPGMPYLKLHSALTHEALMFLLERAGI